VISAGNSLPTRIPILGVNLPHTVNIHAGAITISASTAQAVRTDMSSKGGSVDLTFSDGANNALNATSFCKTMKTFSFAVLTSVFITSANHAGRRVAGRKQ
jgi:hypothetical protein